MRSLPRAGKPMNMKVYDKKLKNKRLTPVSKTLRRNTTAEERRLWYDFLKDLPFPVKRQKVLGDYIVDFYCPKYKIAIEIDGSQHYAYSNQKKDEIRDSYLRQNGIEVIRFTNNDIRFGFDGVCAELANRFDLYPTEPDSLPPRG